MDENTRHKSNDATFVRRSKRKEESSMCPFFNPSTSECKVTPYDSSAYQDGSNKEYKCMSSSNYSNCGNYEAYQRGDYKVER